MTRETKLAEPRSWQAAGTYPTGGELIYVITFQLVKFAPYKPGGRRQMGGAKGRWQESREYGGCQNCAAPTGPWVFAGKTVPDALALARAAPDLRDALSALRDRFHRTLLASGTDSDLADEACAEADAALSLVSKGAA